MCECIKNLTEKAKELFSKEHSQLSSSITSCSFENLALIPEGKIFFPVTIETQPGGTGTRIKKHKINFINSYCPFCGEKLEKTPDWGAVK